MTEPGEDGKAKAPRPILRLNLGWLRWSLSWKAALAGVIALCAAAVIFVVVGGVDISADKPDGWLATHGLHFVFKRSVASGANRVTAPADLSAPSRVRLGAQHFDMVCANCHGRPGFGQSVVALSMSPRPQYLPKVIGQFTDAELYVIVEHGVKFSAMPSWATPARGDEVWSMVAFLRRLPTLDAAAYRELTKLSANDASAPTGGEDATLRPANAQRNTPPVNEFLYAAPTAGFSDAAIHETPAATCARCHGANGSGAVTGGEAPNLTLQDAGYLKAALQSYVSGARKSGFMRTVAAQLSDWQITALSNYYANLPVQTIPPSPADPALIKRGEAIASGGIRDRAIPACANCHEGKGAKIIAAPHIAGQSATFLRRQLIAMGRVGRGSTGVWNPMPAVAHDLGDKDIDALAAYYSALPPVKAGGGQQVARLRQDMPSPAALAAAKGIFETQCLKCHVNEGRGDLQGSFPNLTIQNASYAAHSLYSFRTGARLNNKMQEVVNTLSLDQLAGLAQYLHSLPPRPALAKPDKVAASRGEAIAMRGVPVRGVPACLGCHAPAGVAALPLIPALQGQNVGYLSRKLDAFAMPYSRNLSALNPMPAIARQLTNPERADLAAYFAAAPPLEKTTARP